MTMDTHALRERVAGLPLRENVLLVLDLDGTVHAGRFGWGKGLSNIDLAFELGWLQRPLGLPIPPLGWAWRVWKFRLRERRLLRQLGQSRDYYDGVIDCYRRDLLAVCDAEMIARAGEAVSRRAFRDVAAGLAALGELVGEAAIVTKAFDPVVDAYVARVNELAGVSVHGFGNAITVDVEPRHRTGEDKAATVSALLAERPGVEAVIVVGDTRHDIPMGEAARDALGRDRVLFMGHAPKDRDITAAADFTFPNWRAFAAAIGEPAEHAGA